jgi:hypothetical protein
MAIEHQTVVGLDDIKAVSFECGHCKVRTRIPASSLTLPPQGCSSCNSVWWGNRDVSMNVSTSGPAPLGFIQALVTIRAAIRESKDTFRILLEFNDPNPVVVAPPSPAMGA